MCVCVCTNKVPCACLLHGVGTEMRPVREWGVWLNDFTSPFQLQQLPIYIVMQIHGLSQMVLFQHRGCIEIWLFIPSTSQVFNAPSSICIYPPPSTGSGFKSVQSDVSLSNGEGEKEWTNFGRLWQGSAWEIIGEQKRKQTAWVEQRGIEIIIASRSVWLKLSIRVNIIFLKAQRVLIKACLIHFTVLAHNDDLLQVWHTCVILDLKLTESCEHAAFANIFSRHLK